LTLFEKRFADFPAFGWTQRFSSPVENVIIKRELIDGEQGDDALAYVKKLSALSKGRGPCQMPKPHPAQIKFE
jgi:hypothetical protein